MQATCPDSRPASKGAQPAASDVGRGSLYDDDGDHPFAVEGDDADAAVGAGSDIWTWLDFALKDLYDKLLSVSTIAACVAASVCLILMNFSTDDRAVATSCAWLKRIFLSWVILNVLGFIMTYLVNLTQGGACTG